MSGRSAHVRAKQKELKAKAAKAKQPNWQHEQNFLDELNGVPATFRTQPVGSSAITTDGLARSRSDSVPSESSSYNYAIQSPQPYQQAAIPNSVPRSGMRSQYDDLGVRTRGTIGSWFKGGNKNRSFQIGEHESSDSGSRSTVYSLPSTAVQSFAPTQSSTTKDSGSFARYSPPKSPTISRSQQLTSNIPMRLLGGGRGPQPGWKLLSKNPELWDKTGDTFIYMYMKGSKSKPPPSFRINSAIIYESGSHFFINQLHDYSSPPGWPRFCPGNHRSSKHNKPLGGGNNSAPAPRHLTPQSGTYLDIDDIEYQSPVETHRTDAAKPADGILYEIYVPWPGQTSGTNSTLWHITTRNFFAVLCNANSLIGTTLYDALVALYERLYTYEDYLDRTMDRVAFITEYVLHHKFDDVRNNPSFAASLLAFSELPEIQWKEGYVEAFVHCVGMANDSLKNAPEWCLVSPVSRTLIDAASLEMENRVYEAQRWLNAFDFVEMWPMTSAPPSAARTAFDRLRKWLNRHYENFFTHWPPTASDQVWLKRELIVRLRRDFYGLYDYFVDRDVIFDGASEYRREQKWMIASKSGQTFNADTPDLRFTDIIIRFDDKNNFPHVPHPYPKTPASVTVVSRPKSSFHLKKPATPFEVMAQSRSKIISYVEASNLYLAKDSLVDMDLVQPFINFEKTDQIELVDPCEARRGRWLLIYGILQVLATVCVDHPDLRHSDGVRYHVSALMKGGLPWTGPGIRAEEEAIHKRSHCWTVPNSWPTSAPKAKQGSYQPIMWGQYGDGRARVDKIEDSPNVIQVSRTVDTITRKKRAEEWVNTAPSQMDVGSEIGVGMSSYECGSRGDGVKHSPPNEEAFDSVAGDRVDLGAMPAKQRRAHVHGFSDFKPPEDW